MHRFIVSLLVLTAIFTGAAADFDEIFADSTLRIDVSISRTGRQLDISIDSMALWRGWYGRRVNLDMMHYPEALQIAVTDTTGRDTLYVDTKYLDATVYQTGGPVHATLLVPCPRRDAVVSVSAGGRRHRPSATLALTQEMLADMQRSDRALTPYLTLRKAADPRRCVNIAMLAEGYTGAEMDSFLHHACRLDSALFAEPAFRDNAHLFNVVAVMLTSQASGVSRPSQGRVVRSALRAHFDSFDLDRLITLPDIRPVWDALESVPAAQVFILANTVEYGGSGPYNEYAVASAANSAFPGIIIHEFGHTFTSLGDEYEAGYSINYPPDIEPSEPNITTLHDFSGKWQNLIDKGEASLIEGAGYQEKGVWRGCEHCLMRSLDDIHFCPVCNQAIARTIAYYTEEGAGINTP